MEYAPIFQPANVIERLGHRWMTYWHGEGAPHQYRYHRCKGCHKLLTWKVIRKGGCDCLIDKHIVPAKLSFAEKFRILVMPWSL